MSAARSPAARHERLAAATILALFWAVHAIPVLVSGERWGIWDWDHHLAVAQAERIALLEYGVLPLWNPWLAGGTVLLQHPLAASLVPDFVGVLAFGPTLGLKLLLALRLAIGLAGGYVLARALGLGRTASVLASLLMGGSGAFASHVGYGHFEWTLLGYVPWTLLALLRALEPRGWPWGVGAAAGLAVLFLGGGVYLLFGLAFLVGAYAVVLALVRRDPLVLARLVLLVVVAGGLSAAKLLPAAALFSETPRRVAPGFMLFAGAGEPSAGVLEIPKALAWVFVASGSQPVRASRDLLHEPSGQYDPTTKHERGRLFQDINFNAYVGLLPLLLVPLAFLWRPSELLLLPWCVGLALLLLISLSDAFLRSLGFGLWEALRQLPVLGTLRSGGRFLVIAVIPLALLAGAGLETLQRRWPWRGALLAALAVTCVVGADLAARNATFFARIFPFEPPVAQPGPFVTYAFPRQGFSHLTVLDRVGSYYGFSNLIGVGRAAIPVEMPDYRGEVWLERGGTAVLEEIRPNEVTVALTTHTPDRLTVNQSWFAGWERVDRPAPVYAVEGRVATDVTPDDRRVRLRFRPPLLGAGMVISLVTLAGALVALTLRLRRAR